MPRFDPDRRLSPGADLSFLTSAEWWNGLLEHVRRGSRLMADPATGLQVQQGTDNNTIALAGSYPEMWARASAGISAATGTVGEAMGFGTVRLWIADAGGTRTDSGVDVTAYNGSLTAVGADRWLLVRKVANLWTVVYEDCPT